MTSLALTILYVADPAASKTFYGELSGRQPVDISPTFVLFAFEGGSRLGLWRSPDVTPTVTATPGGAEVCFLVEDDAAVESAHKTAVARGQQIALPPTQLDFGYSTVILDPDGHRVRIYKLNA